MSSRQEQFDMTSGSSLKLSHWTGVTDLWLSEPRSLLQWPFNCEIYYQSHFAAKEFNGKWVLTYIGNDPTTAIKPFVLVGEGSNETRVNRRNNVLLKCHK
ncbi:hypothetical protein CEXT_474831 [Caerostris extrusa]|uniref:Uncharacterized protein n=1 Tax=Caerostris extrusa TaxID=172846 RepID=A0AAV4T9Q0_CAEEX|nr:hypothetical protein CEXT_474831 [Caerostris extrusa]